MTYDNNGNLQTITDSSGTTTYTWNARNQLVAISGPGISASFLYDGLGRRESKTVNGNLTEFLYDGRNPVQETSGATVLANILPGLRIDEFLTRTDVVAAVTSNFLTDALGSPVAVTDGAGIVQTEYTYEPFGKTTFSGASNSSSYQYTGRENDGTGLYYYRARYFYPGLQRFISEDPIGFHGGDINLYNYVGDSPTNGTDPSGNLSWLERFFLGRVGGLVAGQFGPGGLFNPDPLENDWRPEPVPYPPVPLPIPVERPPNWPPVYPPPYPPPLPPGGDLPGGEPPGGGPPPSCGRKCPPPEY